MSKNTDIKAPKSQETALDHVLKYTGVFGGVQGLTILMSIVRNKLASHFLGPVGFGLMGVYQAIAEFAGSTTNCGIPFSSVRELSELTEGKTDRDNATLQRHPALLQLVAVIRTWCLWTALAGVLFTLAGAPLLWRWFFPDGEVNVWSIALLAPMVAALSITGGEISILKGMRRLRRIALISAVGAVSTLCLTVPFFWSMGLNGILLALNCSTIALTGIHLSFTLPLFPYVVHPLSRQMFLRGWGMVRIGIPYVLAAIAGSGVAMALPALMKNYGSIEDLGQYRAIYGLMVTYAGIVFTAFEADYFPRLSGVNRDPELRNLTINQQIRVCVLLIAPILIAMMVGMPVIVRLLYTEKFLPAVPMAICAAFYMFLRAVTTPIGYTALACGQSGLFLLMEVIYDVVSLALIFGCYEAWGLTGAGLGLSLSALFDLLLIGITYSWHYGFRLTRSTLLLVLQQALLMALAVAGCLWLPTWWRWLCGLLLLVLSARLSYGVLSAETTVIEKIRHKLFHWKKGNVASSQEQTSQKNP